MSNGKEISGLHVNNALWLISDTHFGHRNIVQYQQRPATHDVIMLSHWIDRVGEKDHILHLGDVALGQNGNRKKWIKVLSRLPGKKFLILGNHDKERKSVYEAAGFTIMEPFVHKGYALAFTHYPHSTIVPAPSGDWAVNIHGHIHLNPPRAEDGSLDKSKRYINLSVENTDLAPVQLGNVLSVKKYDTEFEEDLL